MCYIERASLEEMYVKRYHLRTIAMYNSQLRFEHHNRNSSCFVVSNIRWLISSLLIPILSSVRSSRYSYKKRFNSCVEVLCVVNVSSMCVVEDCRKKRTVDVALFPGGTRFGERKDEGRKERNAREGCLLPSTNSIRQHLAPE